jgi:hypothetical protein
VARRYQCAKASSRRIVPSVERSEDALGESWWAAAIDELEHCVQVGSPVGREARGEPGRKAGSLEAAPTPCHDADQISIDARLV